MKTQIKRFAMIIGMVSIAAIGCNKDDDSTTTSTTTSTSTVKSLNVASSALTAFSAADSVANSTDANTTTFPDGVTFNSTTGVATYKDVKVDNGTMNGTISANSDGSITFNVSIVNSSETVQFSNFKYTISESGDQTTNGTIIVTTEGKTTTLSFSDLFVKSGAEYASSGSMKLVVSGGDTILFDFLADGLCNMTVNSEAKQTNIKQSEVGF